MYNHILVENRLDCRVDKAELSWGQRLGMRQSTCVEAMIEIIIIYEIDAIELVLAL